MIEVNPMGGPLMKTSGIIAVETPDGHQSWALIVDAEIRYDNDVTVSYGESPQYTVIATLPPGESLRGAHTIEVGEENMLVYSRLLVAVLREERDRYAELERRFHEQGVQLRRSREEVGALVEDRDEMLRAAWKSGATNAWFESQRGTSIEDVLAENPHPPVERDEEEL